MPIRIVTDSTADLPIAMIKAYDITVVPLKVIFGDDVLIDGVDINQTTFFERLKNEQEVPTTSQVNPDEFSPVFQKLINQGDEIIGIFISSNMSGTVQSANIAKKDLNSNDIHIIDSQTVTFELGYLVVRAAQMAKEGKDIKTIIESINALKSRTQLYAIIDTLEYLVKGGRLKSTTGAIGKALKLKPIITIRDGLVESISKQRGRKKAYKWIKAEMDRRGQTISGKTVFVGHSHAPEKMEDFKQWLRTEWKPKEIIVNEIGPIVGVHAGPGCVGLVVVDE